MPEGRVTTATVLFCDLVGSTAQRAALGDDAADRVAVSLDQLLRAAVARHGGSVVKSTGDGLMAVFDAASDALSAAVAAHQATDRHNHDAPDGERLQLRVGVSAGDVRFVAHDCHGLPVVEAARLEAAAEPGAVYASGLVRLLAGSRGGHRFEPVGQLELKGLPQAVETFRVLWDPAPESPISPAPPTPLRIPLPSRFESRALFVGRDHERAALRRGLDAALADRACRVEVVSGEPGIGKTSLAAAFAHEAHELGAAVCYGRCDEDRAFAYQPWILALSHLCAHAPLDLLRDHVEARGGALARFVPEIGARVEIPAQRVVDPTTDQYLLFGAVVDLLRRAAERAPLLLVLDDLHWADDASLLLFRHMVSTLGSVPVLMIANYRDSDLRGDHAWTEMLTFLVREAPMERLPLEGLGADALLSLLEQAAGHELDADGRLLRDLLLAETDGNPFFVTEILRHLAETGAIAQDAVGRWAATGDLRTLGLPLTVREVIRQRVARLDGDAQQVIGAASVIGREFDLDLLVAVAGDDEDRVLDALEVATAAGLVHAVPGLGDRFGFAHALVEHTLYDDQLVARRRRAHRRVADALAAMLGDDPRDRIGELAHHFLAADPESDEALDYATMAGQHALRRLAPTEAVRWFAAALDALDRRSDPDPHRRCALMIELGVAKRDAGDGESRAVLLEAAATARSHGFSRLLIDAALANTRGWAPLGTIDDARVDVLRAALEACGTADSSERARLLATVGAETSYASDWRERMALSDEGLAIARRLGDDDAISYALARRAHSVWVPDVLEQRLADTAENLELTARLPNLSARFWAAFYRITALATAGVNDEIPGLLASLQTIADEVGLPLFEWESTVQRAWRALVSGHLDDADRLTFSALDLGTTSDQPDAQIVFAAGALLVRLEQGRIGEIVDLLAETALGAPGLRGLRASVALAFCDLGRDDDAREWLAEETGSGFASVPYDQFWVVTLNQWALVVGHLREAEAATLLEPLLDPWAGQMAFTGAHLFGAVEHGLALCAATLGRNADADRRFAAALEAYERFDAPAWAARLRVAWAEALHTRGDASALTRARGLAAAARAATDAQGLPGVGRHAQRVLDALG